MKIAKFWYDRWGWIIHYLPRQGFGWLWKLSEKVWVKYYSD